MGGLRDAELSSVQARWGEVSWFRDGDCENDWSDYLLAIIFIGGGLFVGLCFGFAVVCD